MAVHSFTRARHRRKALRRLHRLHFFGDPALSFMYTDLTPCLHTERLSSLLSEPDAEHLARTLPGSRVVPGGSLWRGGRPSEPRFRVVRQTRLGAPFRQPAMTWALQEHLQRDEVQSHLRDVDRHGRYRGWHSNSPGWLKRRFRRLGRAQGRRRCHAEMQGDEHAAEREVPEGYLGNLHWLVD